MAYLKFSSQINDSHSINFLVLLLLTQLDSLMFQFRLMLLVQLSIWLQLGQQRHLQQQPLLQLLKLKVSCHTLRLLCVLKIDIQYLQQLLSILQTAHNVEHIIQDLQQFVQLQSSEFDLIWIILPQSNMPKRPKIEVLSS